MSVGTLRSENASGAILAGMHFSTATAPTQEHGVKTLSIKTKVTIIATAACLALLVLVSAILMYGVKSDMKEDLGNHQFGLVSRVADEIDGKIGITQLALVSVSRLIPREFFNDAERLQNDLEHRSALLTLFDDLFV